MSNIKIDKSNNVYSGGDYIGSVCYKLQGHWTAYLATTTGDEVVGQYDTDVLAAVAVGEAAAAGEMN
ncbi:hypothetical protein D0962_09585 [Leptolyngbyaceae cyanobacterium CCMR0082]|uniref:Uncharacterized protein n=1 Tax=Adonisia turfae CCMR0082 TaxID=2304604 RepID=A0A6M0S3D4_9CYAN|nr:hypothetical protein [Adonisia turfae CCMR0082]